MTSKTARSSSLQTLQFSVCSTEDNKNFLRSERTFRRMDVQENTEVQNANILYPLKKNQMSNAYTRDIDRQDEASETGHLNIFAVIKMIRLQLLDVTIWC